MKRLATEAGLAVARGLWRGAPAPLRRALGLRIGAGLRDGLAGGVVAPPWRAPAEPSPIVVSAFYAGPTGVAAAGRGTADALERAGFSVIRHDLGALLDAGGFQAHDLPGAEDGVWLIHANPPEAKLALARLRRAGWERRYRIGYWAWELPRAPQEWLNAARALHEVWAPSPFVVEALAGAETRLVERPHPSSQVADVRADRERFDLPEGVVVFLAMADLKSGLRRKNPMGAVEAFRRAYPEPQSDALLVVKAHSSGGDAEAVAALRDLASRPDVRLIEANMEHARVLSLVASADVLLSLHRAEGFGLPIAEALALGRAVLATGWSGSQVLLEGILQAQLPYVLAPVVDPGGPYDVQGALWAEPDLDAAAAAIRRLAGDAALRAQIAETGRRRLAELDAAWARERLLTELWAGAVASRVASPGV